jgi:tetratricopeptide (TPR) repeat protein
MASLYQNWYRQQKARLAYRRGLSCARKAMHAQAIAAFTEALEASPAQAMEATVRRGLSRVEIKDVMGAIADFDSAILRGRGLTNAVISNELDQNAPDQNASSQHAPDQNEPAEPNFELAQAHYHRGLLRQQMGNEAGALADWSAAIAHWPNYFEPCYQRALVYLSQGHHSQALEDLNAALTGNPTLSMAYLQRGNLRYQLGDIPAAVTDWELAVCNDFTLEAAKQKLATVQQNAHDAELSAVLKEPLAAKGLTAQISHSGAQLAIHIYRQLGTGVNYYTLPDLIRKYLVPLHLAEVKKFRLIGHIANVNRPEWNQSYELYKGQPCPPSNWETAFSALVVFPPFGIPAFIQAAQVKTFYSRGQYIEALRASNSVRGFCVAGSVMLGFFTLLPLSYAAYDSMQETPTLGSVVERPETLPHRPYQQIRGNSSISE